MKKNVIIFGLGRNYYKYKDFIENNFEVVALMDNYIEKEDVIRVDDIQRYEYDIVLITPF